MKLATRVVQDEGEVVGKEEHRECWRKHRSMCQNHQGQLYLRARFPPSRLLLPSGWLMNGSLTWPNDFTLRPGLRFCSGSSRPARRARSQITTQEQQWFLEELPPVLWSCPSQAHCSVANKRIGKGSKAWTLGLVLAFILLTLIFSSTVINRLMINWLFPSSNYCY